VLAHIIPAGTGGLEKESIVLCYQIRTLDKNRLTKKIGKYDRAEGEARKPKISAEFGLSV
jgi:mRNA-degrading endonuclease toxin of MazEF toxin-antitoxin module